MLQQLAFRAASPEGGRPADDALCGTLIHKEIKREVFFLASVLLLQDYLDIKNGELEMGTII